MGKLDGKVAVVTGAGRGQGRSHAVMLHNPAMYKVFRPELDEVTPEDFERASAVMFPLPISWPGPTP